MRIQTLQRIGGLLAGLSCLMLGGWIILSNYEAYHRFDLGAHSYKRLTAAFAAANAISSERGPSNSAMGATPDNNELAMAALEEKRDATDEIVESLLAHFADELSEDASLRLELTALMNALSAGRSAVDAVAALPTAERQGQPITSAIESMFAAADQAIRLRDHLAQVVIADAPQISTEIVVATTASDLREFEGRLGSYVVMMLTSGVIEDVRHRQNYTHTRVRLSVLRDLLTTYTRAYFNSPSIEAVLARVEEDYFDAALGYVEEVALRHGPDNSMSAGEFTAAYIPMMASSEQLREAVTKAAEARLVDLRDSSLRTVVIAALLTLFALLVLICVAVLFSTRLFAPLLTLSDQVNILAGGDLEDPPEQPPPSREVAQMFASLGALRRQMREKQRLERDQLALTEKLQTLAQTDMLTGLPNRRAITDRARDILRTADRRNEPVGVIMLDIDHFKRINDNFGHDMGDMVLQLVARTLPPILRANDVFGRYGGEEFLAIVPNATDQNVVAIAEKLRQALEKIETGKDFKVTGSFGLGIRDAGSQMSWENLVSIADRQLYRAKSDGRNRVSGPGQLPPEAA
ncbi:MAG: GGDEF domain-containing protein [Phyllobacteriaceae bacterium]|nr:GGDEF domain-containing protein [Phyllobacteriaceae bacterium]